MNPEQEVAASGAPEPTGPVKAMRRQPCPCGSEKKFKNCHEGRPGYEVATDAADAPAAAPATAGAHGAAKKHFPGKDAKNIASQKPFHAHFFKRG